MGRELKRVPLDFEYPLRKIWKGYTYEMEELKNNKTVLELVPEIKDYKGESLCENCDRIFNNCSEKARYCIPYNKVLRKEWYYEPPVGTGFQLWENTSEGSPASPVFETLEELSEWCEENATTFANFKTTKEEWFKMLSDDNVYHKSGNCIFL